MQDHHISSDNLAQIEHRARQLRAQFLASGVKKLIIWVKSTTHFRANGENRTV